MAVVRNRTEKVDYSQIGVFRVGDVVRVKGFRLSSGTPDAHLGLESARERIGMWGIVERVSCWDVSDPESEWYLIAFPANGRSWIELKYLEPCKVIWQ